MTLPTSCQIIASIFWNTRFTELLSLIVEHDYRYDQWRTRLQDLILCVVVIPSLNIPSLLRGEERRGEERRGE
jgi:hypothetical protein